MAVAGVGDVAASAMLSPPMTSIKPPIEQMAKASVESLIHMIENNKTESERQVFTSQVLIRSSI